MFCGSLERVAQLPHFLKGVSIMTNIIGFQNGLICRGGELRNESLYVDLDSGFIVDEPSKPVHIHYDLHGQILAPAFLELQTNGCAGFHFTNFTDPESYKQNLANVSKYLPTTGVGSFWATIPTVRSDVFQSVSAMYISSYRLLISQCHSARSTHLYFSPGIFR